MAGFDGERYLRRRGEELLVDGSRSGGRHPPWDSPLLEQAHALVAVGAVDPDVAQAVIGDYGLADMLRSEQAGRYREYLIARSGRTRGARASQGALAASAARAELARVRVVPVATTIEDSGGTMTLRHVALTASGASIAMTWQPAPTARGRVAHRRGLMSPRPGGHPPSPMIVDDRGTTVASAFGGSGSDTLWEGHLSTQGPLALDTEWIELDGTRVALDGEPWPAEVSIEALPDASPGERYAWNRIAARDHGRRLESVDPLLRTLVAAGAIDAADPALESIRAVHAALPRHPHMRFHSPPSHAATNLPHPWRSLLQRGQRQDGPDGLVALGVTTPEFEGFTVVAAALESMAEGFTLDAYIAPGLGGLSADLGFGSPTLTWWAEDDRGTSYLGASGSWNRGDAFTTAQLSFWPAIDPKASRLRLLPTATATRAVIDFALPWAT